jgi:DNA-binding PadR family transcriptional regulator
VGWGTGAWVRGVRDNRSLEDEPTSKRMKPFRYHILLALTRGSLHGAEIRRRVESESGGEVILYPATLYGTLDELSEEGWIQEVEPDHAEGAQARRRVYALTPVGRHALETETRRLEEVLTRAKAALRAVGGA